MPTTDVAKRRVRNGVLAFGAVLIAASAAGCLPSGTRGEGSGGAASGASAQPTISASPTRSGPTPRPPIIPPTPTPRPTFLVYVVAKGDSLNTIAHRFGTTARSIAFWNRSTYPSLDPESAGYRPGLLKLGWTLFLVPNDVVDEEDLPEPSLSAADPADAALSVAPGVGPSEAPGDSAIPE
jgi:LysM domain